MVDHRVLIVGAGAAGAAAAATLTRHAPQASVTLMGGEPGPPYNRTAVNKGLLLGEMTLETMVLPEASALEHLTYCIDQAARLDLSARTVTCASGQVLPFDSLIVASGTRPVRCSAQVSPAARSRVLNLRTAADGLALRELVKRGGQDVVVIGAGLIGNETAGVVLDLGNRVSIVSRRLRPMADRWGTTVSDWLVAEQRSAGVRLELGRRASAIERAHDGRLEVRLDDETALPADVVVTSTGVEPDVEWLSGAGIADALGVPVDAHMRTPLPGIYAAGDVTVVMNGGQPHRVEHWGSAIGQGRSAARALLEDLGLPSGAPNGADPLPSYNSYFRDAKLTVLGDPQGFTRETVLVGSPRSERFTVALTDDDERVLSVIGVRGARAANRLKDIVAARATVHGALEVLG